MNPATGQIVPNPIPGPNGQMLDPATHASRSMNRQQQLDQRNAARPGGGSTARRRGGIFNPRGRTNQ